MGVDVFGVLNFFNVGDEERCWNFMVDIPGFREERFSNRTLTSICLIVRRGRGRLHTYMAISRFQW